MSVELFVFFVMGVMHLEPLTTAKPLFGTSDLSKDWRWFWLAVAMPFASMGLATVYTFFQSRKNGYILAAAAVLYSAFLLVSESVSVSPSYVCVPQAVTAVVLAMYLVSVFMPRLPHRRKVASGVMAVLALSMLVAYLFAEGGFYNVMDWGLSYIPPVVAFALLGNTLPEK